MRCVTPDVHCHRNAVANRAVDLAEPQPELIQVMQHFSNIKPVRNISKKIKIDQNKYHCFLYCRVWVNRHDLRMSITVWMLFLLNPKKSNCRASVCLKYYCIYRVQNWKIKQIWNFALCKFDWLNNATRSSRDKKKPLWKSIEITSLILFIITVLVNKKLNNKQI